MGWNTAEVISIANARADGTPVSAKRTASLMAAAAPEAPYFMGRTAVDAAIRTSRKLAFNTFPKR